MRILSVAKTVLNIALSPPVCVLLYIAGFMSMKKQAQEQHLGDFSGIKAIMSEHGLVPAPESEYYGRGTIVLVEGQAPGGEDPDKESPHYYQKIQAIGTVAGIRSYDTATSVMLDGTGDGWWVIETENGHHSSSQQKPNSYASVRNVTKVVPLKSPGSSKFDILRNSF